jgi:ribonuclease T1
VTIKGWHRPSRKQVLGLVTVVAITLLGMVCIIQYARNVPSPPQTAPATTADNGTPRSNLPTVNVVDLPPEAVETLGLIDQGGPYPYRQDGATYHNFEKLLPQQPSGYYREFTVPTPGSDDRGPRRLVVGLEGDIYYTDDHYQSFRQVLR